VANFPIVILTYGFSGETRLQRLLERSPDIVCTTATGIVPACDMAWHAWQRAERPPVTGTVSSLAIRSVRAMTDGMITAIVTRYGGRRWCENATVDPRAAGSFLMLFPGTRVICLHRSCDDFVYSVLNASPWGGDAGRFAASTPAYPLSPVSAISSWWASRSRLLLAFEESILTLAPGSFLRI
jgi:hypothetical protein